jgi:protein-L-isoaspartate(D-aspartate) O-methyltransferase
MAHNIETQRQQLISSLRNAGIHDERILTVIATTPRELFIEEARRNVAYADCALPIGLGGKERVLEIGTGSGYQTAILAQLSACVYSIERHQQLAYHAARNLMQLSLTNVSLYVGDGSLGWPDAAPYDRILVTAAAPVVPQLLLDQLVTWGILVIPVGSQVRQDLLVVYRAPWGPEIRSLGGCVFVPLVGEKGWSESKGG